MTLGVYQTSTGKQVIADSSEAQALGYTSSDSNDKRNSNQSGTITHPIGGTIESQPQVKALGGIMQEVGGKTTYISTPNSMTTVHLEAGPPFSVSANATPAQLGQIYLQTGYSFNSLTGQFYKVTAAPLSMDQQIHQIELARLTYQASNLNPAELFAYAIWNPFQFRSTIPATIAILQGKSPAEVKQIAFESGQLEFKKQAYYNPIQFYETMALGSLAFSVPAITTTTGGAVVASAASLGAGQYDITRKMMENRLDFTSAAIDLTAIGLGALGIKTAMTQLNIEAQQTKLIDPILSKIDVKGYYDSAAEFEAQRTLFVPKYGTEYGLGEAANNLKINLLGQPKTIYGVPQEIPEAIKPFDFAYEINYAVNNQGVEILKTVSFKVTDKGMEQLGMIELNRYYPSEPKGLTNILDYFAPDKLERWQLDLGYTKNLVIKGGQPSIDIGEIDFSSSMNRIISIKQIAIEKPIEFVPTMFKGSPSIWITTGDYTPTFDFISVTDINKVFDNIAGKIYLNAPGKSFGAAQIAISKPAEVVVNEIPTPIGYNEVGGFRFNAPKIDYVFTPSSGNFYLNIPASLNIERLANIESGGSKSTMINENRMAEITVPISFNRINYITGNRVDTNQIQFNVEIAAPITLSRVNQTQEMQNVLEMQTFSGYSTSTNTSSYKIIKPETDFNLPLSDSGMLKRFSIIIKSDFGKPKMFKISSVILPTAGLYSLEKAFARYGSGSLARGSDIEKMFRNLARSSGLAAEFPAAEFLKRGGKRK